MRRNMAIIISGLLLIGFLFSGCTVKKSEKIQNGIGVVVAKFDDTWRTSVRNELYKLSEGKIKIDIWNSDGSQKTENEKVETLIKSKVKVLVINLVETSGADEIIAMAKKADIPVIFFNTEPSSEALNKWNKVYYVGAKGEQSGSMQGSILAGYFKNKPTKDGIIRYVMLKGQAGHPDMAARTEYSVKALQSEGLKLQEVASVNADWERSKAQQQMEQILAAQSNIDCVIANNDDMALGAIDALKEKGYFSGGRYIPVVGVDALGGGVNALQNGTLLGTVLNDAESQGKAIFELAAVLAEGKLPDKNNIGNSITDEKYIWIDYKIITKENIGDAK